LLSAFATPPSLNIPLHRVASKAGYDIVDRAQGVGGRTHAALPFRDLESRAEGAARTNFLTDSGFIC